MHQPWHRALVVGLHRHHIAVGAHGDDGLLQGFCVGGRRENLLQRLPGAGGGGAHLAADVRQFIGGAVCDLVLPNNRGGDLLLQELVGPQGVEERIDAGLPQLVVRDVAPHQPGALQHSRNVQQLPGVQSAAQIGSRQGGAHVLDAGKRGAAPHHHHGFGSAGLLQTVLDLKGIRGGGEQQRPLLGHVAHGLLRQHVQYGRQLQGIQGFFKKTHVDSPLSHVGAGLRIFL